MAYKIKSRPVYRKDNVREVHYLVESKSYKNYGNAFADLSRKEQDEILSKVVRELN